MFVIISVSRIIISARLVLSGCRVMYKSPLDFWNTNYRPKLDWSHDH